MIEFVLVSVEANAKKNVEEHNRIISSKKDQEIFFNAIVNAPLPNESLGNAASRYNDLTKKFYLKYGFILLPDSNKMFLSIKTIGKLFNS